MAPASCSPWPCCERGVTSCLSLCLSLALAEGPRGAGRGCDGSAADPRGYGPPGPGSGCLAARAAHADGHRPGPRSLCRVPGLFSLYPPTPSLLTPPTHTPPWRGAGSVTAASSLAVSQAQPRTHSLAASHSWTCIQSLTRTRHTRAPIQSQAKDVKTQTWRSSPGTLMQL